MFFGSKSVREGGRGWWGAGVGQGWVGVGAHWVKIDFKFSIGPAIGWSDSRS